MASKQTTQAVADLATVYRTLAIDLPLAATRWGLGAGKEKETTEVAWKAYDAGVRLATTAVDSLYRSPLAGTVTARALNVFLRGQQLSNALAGVVFTGLWQSVGLPTAAETQALRTEVQALREDVRALGAVQAIRRKVKPLSPVEEREEMGQASQHHNGAARPIRSAA